MSRILLCFPIFSIFFLFGHQERIPAGHLQPLGSHRPSEGNIKSIDFIPSPKDFFKEYASISQPVIFKGAAKLSPGFSLWTDNYIR